MFKFICKRTIREHQDIKIEIIGYIHRRISLFKQWYKTRVIQH